jgi:hypothetical protein
MQIVEQQGIRLAVKLEADDFTDGLSFFTKDEEFIQVGSWRYGSGRNLAAHNHNVVPRTFDRTQEVIVVLRGRVRASIYNEEDVLAGHLVAGQGQVLILCAGGHGYEILEDDTLIIEVKNGPYPGAAVDRRRLSGPKGSEE